MLRAGLAGEPPRPRGAAISPLIDVSIRWRSRSWPSIELRWLARSATILDCALRAASSRWPRDLTSALNVVTSWSTRASWSETRSTASSRFNRSSERFRAEQHLDRRGLASADIDRDEPIGEIALSAGETRLRDRQVPRIRPQIGLDRIELQGRQVVRLDGVTELAVDLANLVQDVLGLRALRGHAWIRGRRFDRRAAHGEGESRDQNDERWRLPAARANASLRPRDDTTRASATLAGGPGASQAGHPSRRSGQSPPATKPETACSGPLARAHKPRLSRESCATVPAPCGGFPQAAPPGLRAFSQVCSVVLAVPVALGAESSEPSAIRAQVAALQAQESATRAQSHEALVTLYALESELTRAREALAERRESSRRSRRPADRPPAGGSRLPRTAMRVSERRLAEVVRALYQQDAAEPLAVVLGAGSLDEALAGLDNLDRASGEHRRIVERAGLSRTRLTHPRRPARRSGGRAPSSCRGRTGSPRSARGEGERTGGVPRLAAAAAGSDCARARCAGGERRGGGARELRAPSRGEPAFTVLGESERACAARGYASRSRLASARKHVDRVGDRLQPARSDLVRTSGRTRHRSGRSERDPARHEDVRARLRRGRCRRHGRIGSRSRDRPLVPDRCRRTPLGSADSRDPAALTHFGAAIPEQGRATIRQGCSEPTRTKTFYTFRSSAPAPGGFDERDGNEHERAA